jgi:hypothetical protein
MADVTITGLPNASALTGTERVPMDQSGTTVDAAASAIAALATKTTVGLGNADNTSDLNKPISTATQTALDGKAATGAIGSSGLTMTAGVLGRESGTGAPQVYPLGSGLSIVAGALTVTATGSGTVTSVGLSVPTGFAVAGSPITASGTLALTFAAGYSLPLTATQANWDAAAVLAGTAVQPAGLASTLTGYVQTSDARLTDSREWSATTISQAEAEAGSATTRRAFTAQRVFQAAAAWWAATATATGQALASAANAAAARTTLGLGTAATAATGDFAAASHNQAASTISDSTATGRALLTAADAAAARTAIGAGTSSLAVSSSAPAALGATAAAGSSTDAARADHAHQRDSDVIVIPVGDESTALTTGTNKVRFRLPFAATLLAVRANVNTAPTGSTLIVDVNEAGTSVLGTKLSIDATETSSTTAASAATIADSSLADDAEVSIDIDQIGSTVAGAGLKVSLFVRRA